MSNDDALASLVVDERALARQELAEVLAPHIRFTREGELLPQREFDSLTTLKRVACVLLALRAAHALGLRDRPGATPKQVVETSGMPAGTVRPKLGELCRLRIAVKDMEDYLIPSYGIRRAAELIGGQGRD